MNRKPQFAEEGIRHATINKHRIHLRIMDPGENVNYLAIDGRILLVIDKTAADFWRYIIDGMWKFQQGDGDESKDVRDYVLAQMAKQYPGISSTRILSDLDRNFGTVMGVADSGCPVETGLGVKEIDVNKWAAPMRMDLAVTYGCNLTCDKCYVAEDLKKGMKELSKSDWIRIYRTLWRIGVYNVTFTGGEPLLRPDIVELVSEADEFVTGLVTNGTLLEQYAQDLQNASLDYCQVTLESCKSETHDKMTLVPGSFAKTLSGIKKALSLNMQVITNTTLTKTNIGDFIDLLKFNKQLGIKHMSCNSLICSGHGIKCRHENGLTTEELKEFLTIACEKAKETGIELQWYSPTCYKDLNPLEIGFGVKQCSACSYNMTIQPDGTVLPCQSWPKPVGNILTDAWENIWNNPLCRKLRNHGFAPEGCKDCRFIATCGGGCPLESDAR